MYDPMPAPPEIGSRFFETMGIPILYGRAVDEHDMVNGPRAVVVNQQFGRHFFQHENAVGKTFKGSDDVAYQIVGVCADWRTENLRDGVRPTFYDSFGQAPRTGNANFEVRIAHDEAGVVKRIRRTAARSMRIFRSPTFAPKCNKLRTRSRRNGSRLHWRRYSAGWR